MGYLLSVDVQKARQDLGVVTFDGETVVYDPLRAAVHYLNATASIVFALCDGTTPVGQTTNEIAEAYGVSAAQVEEDVQAALVSFAERGLLENGKAPAPSTDERARVRREVPPSE